MKWHADASSKFGRMSHPVDSSCWKKVNNMWPEFSKESRNIRLGLATDGFNPYGNMNISYSCWPVMIVPYNLPPSLCMQKEFTMLSMLIPGKKGPGKDIDVYLQPLIEELNLLWSSGVPTYDSSQNEVFSMKAILLWAIHDFPAYGHLSGCKTVGKYACPICNEGTESQWLKHGCKTVYMGHRRFLPSIHPFRNQKRQFNGKAEGNDAPRRLTGIELFEKVKNIQYKPGKVEE